MRARAGGQFVLDAEAQAFFSVKSSNQLVWSPTAVFGFAKVRYRGLRKNTHRLRVARALANLFIVRRHLLRCDAA